MPRQKRKSKLRTKTPSRVKKRRPSHKRARSLQHPELWGLGSIALGLFLWRGMKAHLPDGDVFKIFMVAYFAFRLACDFLKPEVRVLLGMSSIQWACLLMLCYYAPDIVRWVRQGSRTCRVSGDPIKNLQHTEIVR